MKWLSFVVVAGLLVGVAGCAEEKDKGKGTVKGKDDKELTLSPPSDLTLEQGGSKEVEVKITRKKFDDAVKISFSDLPEGVSVKEGNTEIPKGADSAKFTLEAKDKATVQEGGRAKVKASSGDMKIEKEFKVNVKKKS